MNTDQTLNAETIANLSEEAEMLKFLFRLFAVNFISSHSNLVRSSNT